MVMSSFPFDPHSGMKRVSGSLSRSCPSSTIRMIEVAVASDFVSDAMSKIVSVVIGLRVVVKVQEVGAGYRLMQTPVLDGRRRFATAGLAALLALGIGAPLVLLSMVWDLLKQYS